MTRLMPLLSLLALAFPAASFPNPVDLFAPENVLDLPTFGGKFDSCLKSAIDHCSRDPKPDDCKKKKAKHCLEVGVPRIIFTWLVANALG